MNNDKTVTLPLVEYEQLLANIKEKDDLLTQCIEEGKVLVRDKIVYMVSTPLCYHDDIMDVKNAFTVTSPEELSEDINIEVLRALSRLEAYHQKCDGIYKDCMSYKQKLQNKTLWRRFVYLFTGEA